MKAFTIHQFGIIFQVAYSNKFAICWGTNGEGPSFYTCETKEEFKNYLKLKYPFSECKITFDDFSMRVFFQGNYSGTTYEFYNIDVYKFLKENLV